MKKNLLLAAMAAFFVLVAMPTASATVYYWDGNGATAGAGTAPTGTWGTSTFWTTNASGLTATANNATTALDQVRFSAGTDATGTYTVSLNGTRTARQLRLDYGNITFSGGTINLSSNGTSGSPSNVTNGIFLASTAGNATISSNLTINGIQILNIDAGKTLTLNTGTFTRSAGASLNVLSTGTVASSMTGLSSLTNGILGPWATFGSGSSMQYATVSGGNIAGLTGTAAATAANVTDTTGTFNYNVAGTSTAFGAGASVNTLRFTGGGGTMSGDITANGLMHAGSGATTLSGNVTIGSTRELVVTSANNSFTFSGVLKDNGGGASSLLVTQPAGSATLGLTLSNNNTYSGGTTISNARLSISANNALGTGAVSVLKGGIATVGDYGGQLEVSNNITWSNNMTLAGQGLNGFNGALRNLSGNNTSTGTITIADTTTRISVIAGTLTLNGTTNLSTAAAYTNLFQHAGGDIRIGGNITGSATTFNVLGGGSNFLITDRANAWANTMGLTLGASNSTSYGRVDLNGNNQTVTSLAAAGNVTTENLITNRSSTLATLTINTTSGFTANPTFSGNLVIVKNGGGSATMSSVGTHTGGWIINNGTLSTGSAQTFGTGNITINSGGNATIALNAGTSSYSNNFSIAGSGSGNGALQSNTSGNYTISGAVALTGDATLGSRATSGSGSGLIFTGGISTGGVNRTLTLNTFGGTSGNNTVNTNFITLNSTTNLGTGGTLTMGNGLNPSGTGTFNINVGGNTWGTTIVQGLSTAAASSNATLNLGAANALGSSSSILQLGNSATALEGITVNLNGNNQTIGGLRSFTGTGSASANGTRTVTSATAATLTIDNSSATNYLYDGAISGAISLVKNGTATQTLSGVNTYTGTTTISNGALVFQNTAAKSASSAVTVAAAGTLGLGVGNASIDYSNNVVNVFNNGTLTGFTIDAASGIALDTTNGNFNLSSALTAARALTKLGSNTLTLSGNNTYTGATTINAGTLQIGNGSTSGSLSTSSALTNNGTLVFNRSDTLTQGTDFNSVIGGSGNVTQTGSGVLVLSGANTYTGTTTINAGNLTLTGGSAISDSGAVTLANATGAILHVAQSETIGNLSGGGASGGDVSIAASQFLTVNSTSGATFSGRITGSGGLVKNGGFSLTLSGNNTYTGGTTLNNAPTNSNSVLLMGSNNALGNGALTINASGWNTFLRLNGTNQTITRLTVLGGNISVIENQGGGNGTMTFNLADGVTSNSTSTFYFRDHNGGSGTLGLLKTGNGTLDFSTIGQVNYTGGLTVNQGVFSYSAAGQLGTGGITLGGGTLNYTGSSSVTIANNATLTAGTTSTLNNAAGTITVSAIIAGSGNLTKSGAGTLILSGANSYSGDTSINTGTLVFRNTAAKSASSAVTVAAAGTLGLGVGNASIDYSNNVADVFNNGTLTGFTIDAASCIALDTTNGNFNLSSALTAARALTKLGSNTLTLSGASANTYTGTTTVSAGTLTLDKDTNVVAVRGDLVLNGSSKLLYGTAKNEQIANTASVTINGAGSVFNGSALGAVTGAIGVTETIGSLTVTDGQFNTGTGGNWTVTGAGIFDGSSGDVRFAAFSGTSISFNSLSLTAMNGTTIVTSADSFVIGGSNAAITTLSVGSGGLTLNGSTLGLNKGTSASELGSRLILDGNITTTGSSASFIASNSGANGTSNILLSSTAGSVNRTIATGSGANLTISVPITNGNATTAGIIKDGLGTLTLNGTNTYTGATTINAGTLAISGGAAIADTGTVTLANTAGVAFNVNSSETIASLQGGGATGGNVTIASGQTLTVAEANTNTFSGSLQGSGNFTKSGLGTLTLNGTNINSGAVSVTGGTVLLSGDNALSGSTSLLSAASSTTISLADGVGRTITLSTGNLSLSSATMVFELGSTSDRLTLTNGAATLSGTNTISLANLGSFTAGNYTLISAASGLNAGGTWSLNSAGGPTGFTFSLTSNATTLTLVAAVSDYNFYWTGNASANWSGNNFSATDGGASTLSAGNFSANSDLIFAAAGAGNLSTTMGSDYTVNSLAISTAGVSIGGANTLTVNSTSSSAIAVSASSGNTTISVNLAGASAGLTKTNSGTLILSGSNTYNGTTTLSGGVLNIQHANALGSTANGTTVATGAALQLQGGITVGAEALSLSGTGVSGDGALRNISGTNTYGGNITLATTTRINSDAGLLTLTGLISGTQDLTVGGAGNTAISNTIATSTGALTKDGAGTLMLSGNNTYTGITTISAGTLEIGSTGRLGGGSYGQNISNAGTFLYSGTNNQTLSGIISGSGALTQNNSSTLTLTGANTYTGATTINAGTLQIDSAGRLGGGSYAGNIVNNGTFIYAGNNSQTLSGIISGSGALTKNASATLSTLTLSGNNTYTGITTIHNGTIAISHANALGATGSGNGTRINAGGALALGDNINLAETITLNSTGAGGANGGIRSTSGDNTISGAITLGAASRIVVNSGNLTIAGGVNATNLNLTVGTSASNTSANFTSAITLGSGTLNAYGGNLMNARVVLGVAGNSFAGVRVDTGGTIRTDVANAWNPSANMVLGTTESGNNTNTFDLNGYSQTVASLTSSNDRSIDGNGGSGNVTNTITSANAATLTVNGSSSTIYRGTITGAISLAKAGSSNLTLTGNNTYTGNTTVAGGTLLLSGGGTLGTSVISISGGTLDMGGKSLTNTFGSLTGGTLSNGTLTNDGSNYDLQNGTVSAALAGTNGLNKTTSGTVTLSGANTYQGATTINGGTLQIGAGSTTGSLSSSSAITNNGTLAINRSDAFTFSNTINGSGGLLKSGAGDLTLSGSNSYTGGTTITGANNLIMGANNALGNGALTFNTTATARLNLNGTNQTVTGLTVLGSSAAVIQNEGASSSSIGMVTFNIADGVSSSASNFQFRDSSVTNGAKGKVALVKTGNGTLDFSTTGTMNYSGGLTVNGGNLSYSNVSALGNSTAGGAITLGGGTLNYAGSSSVTIANNATLTDGTTSTLNNAAGTITVSGTIGGTGNLTKSGAGTLTLSAANTYNGTTTVSQGTLSTNAANRISDSSAITVASGATFLLGGNETVGSIAGAGNYSIAGFTLTVGGDNTSTTVSGNITGASGALTKIGTGTLTLSGANTYTGNTTVTLGTLALGESNVISDSSNLIINGGTFDISTYSDTVGAITMTNGSLTGTSGVLTGSAYNITGGIVTAQLGGGTLIIGNGTTDIGAVGSNVGLSVNGSSAVANLTANVSAQSVTLNNGGSITGSFSLNQTGGVTANSGSIASNLIGTGGVTMNGTGNTLTLTGINTYTGATTISAGNLSISSAAALGSTSGVNLADTTALIYTGAAGNLTRDISVTGTTGSTGTIRNSGTGLLTLSGGLSKNGTTLTLAGGGNGITVEGVISGSANNSDLVIDGGSVTLAAANTYNGPTSIINSGTLNANTAGALPTSTLTAVTINGNSTLALGASQSVASLSGTSGSTVNLNANTLTINATSGSTTYAGRITGGANSALVKDGASTQVLTGNNSGFAGSTTIESGTLQAAAAGAMGNSTVINVTGGSFLVTAENAVNDNANINLGGGTLAVSGTFNENVGLLTLSANSTIDLNNFSGILRFSGLSWASTSPNAKLAIWNWSGTTEWGTKVNNWQNPSNLVFSDSTNLTADNLAKISFYSDSGFNSIGSGFIESDFAGPGTLIIAVPETETYITAVILLLGFGIYQLRLARQGEGLLARLTFLRQKKS